MQPWSAIANNGLFDELLDFVHGKVKDKSIAEDIVQDVFIKAYTRSRQLRETDKISGWIYQIARNAIMDHYRASSRSIAPVNVDWDDSYNELNDCVALCLRKLIVSLPEKYRVPLELTEIENYSQHEVAQRLNITYSGARSRVQRARKLLREKLESLYIVKTDSYGNVIVCENRTPCCCKPVN
jgi:RNA polymerase sigma-70 factor, ECF subfamily